MSEEKIEASEGDSNAISRRGFITSAAATGGALAVGGLVPTKLLNGLQKSRVVKKAPTLGEQLRSILGEPKHLLAKGPGVFNTTALFPLSGTGAGQGKLMVRGHKLGLQHVKAWTNGKLDLRTTKYYDNQSGVPAACVAAARNNGIDKNPFMIMSYSFGFGSVPPIAKEFNFLCMDPGGGTAPIFGGLPYCYGTRASWPLDPQEGLAKTIQALHPTAKRWVVVSADVAAPWNSACQTYMTKLYAKLGINLVGFINAPVGQTDYSTTISAVKALNPDVTVFMTFGDDVPYQAIAVQNQNLTGIFAGAEYLTTSTAIAGPKNAYNNWYFGFDFLNVVQPPNDWTKLFIKDYTKTHQGIPGIYEAGYYVNIFNHAILMDDILRQGGNIKEGKAYIKALNTFPTFPHVYGGNGKTLGKIQMNPNTHSLSKIPMVAFQVKGSRYQDIAILATYDENPTTWKLT